MTTDTKLTWTANKSGATLRNEAGAVVGRVTCSGWLSLVPWRAEVVVDGAVVSAQSCKTEAAAKRWCSTRARW